MSSRPRDMFRPFRGSALVPREPEAKEGFQIFSVRSKERNNLLSILNIF